MNDTSKTSTEKLMCEVTKPEKKKKKTVKPRDLKEERISSATESILTTATNESEARMANGTTKDLSPKHLCFVCINAIFVIEFVVIFIMNAYTITVFARNQNLCKRTTYLIINLTIADLLSGAVSGPLELFYMNRTLDLHAGFSWQKLSSVTFLSIFTISSLTNLSLISLERLHATVYPFSHCSLGGKVYFKVIIFSWVLSVLISCVDAVLFVFMPVKFFYVWASHIVFALLIIAFSYITIIVKVHKHPPAMPYGTTVAGSDTKLSITLFIVTVVSLVTTLPWALYAAIKPMHIWNRKSQIESELTINFIVHGLYYACSVANPLIYSIRMKKFRKAVIKGLPFKRSHEESRHKSSN
ncbi:neuromedin-U receptor 1-like isoform X2 [Montipora foliosa]|uniref:neuromedin-U receptor 1-like isoform X2 n=1 Tax=Montipora foliosa TaxID=591990 RepID=UPI0035F1032E